MGERGGGSSQQGMAPIAAGFRHQQGLLHALDGTGSVAVCSPAPASAFGPVRAQGTLSPRLTAGLGIEAAVVVGDCECPGCGGPGASTAAIPVGLRGACVCGRCGAGGKGGLIGMVVVAPMVARGRFAISAMRVQLLGRPAGPAAGPATTAHPPPSHCSQPKPGLPRPLTKDLGAGGGGGNVTGGVGGSVGDDKAIHLGGTYRGQGAGWCVMMMRLWRRGWGSHAVA